MDEEHTSRKRPFIRGLVPDWRPTRAQVQRAIRITVVVVVVLLVVLFVLYLIGLSFHITLLNLLNVLAVPITVGAAVPLLNWLQKSRELAVEGQRAQDEALQAYLSQMANLLIDRHLLTSHDDDNPAGRTLARARTLWVLWQIDGHRKGNVLRFLHEADLIRCESKPQHKSRIVNLSGADLRYGQLQYIDLEKDALNGADLKVADLSKAKLKGADLSGADLKESTLKAADLSKANLFDADLSKADLSEADLTYAQDVTEEQLKQAQSVKNATMPNGQKYENWLKDKKVINCLRVRDGDLPPYVKKLEGKEGCGEEGR